MKYIVLVAALASLSACGGAATEEESSAAPAEMVVEEAPAMTAADGGPSTGTFEITNAKGEVSTEVLAADGTFTSTNAAGESKTGVWEQRSPNEFCAQDADETEMTCFAEAVGDDGVWTSTDPDDGEVSTVKRVAS
ncbi:hypothetical protein [Qipengyuania marisflavi]|uniref:Uncharacterized protein n=1 Tax=Qipengyuania marisflavi TaxID=2486356 RepID=A0A5S3PC50_9SPHN|nr:hypothetical protein [Qipengyuania marisflavi]TMM48819.1 hypothetical protein FEV51_05340 [Qipengyuania marisflavi]